MTGSPAPRTFGRWLHDEREQALLTQEDLAALAGVNARTIRDIERGRISNPRAATQRLLAKALAGTNTPQAGYRSIAVDLPRELPQATFAFTGRDAQIRELDTLLATRDGQNAPSLAMISGTPGVGKTALAVTWAHRVSAQFPHGQLYVNLRGYDTHQPVSSSDALATLLRSLGMLSLAIPPDLGERAARFRTLVADRRLLIVLDNAHTLDQIRPLLPGTRSCFVVVTSRNRFTELRASLGAHYIDLGVLAAQESTVLLRRLIGERVDHSASAAVMMANACGHLPLALRLAAEFVVARPNLTVDTLVRDLRTRAPRATMESMGTNPRSALQNVFSWSFGHLSPDATTLFVALGCHPSPELSLPAMQALLGSGNDATTAAAYELARAALVDDVGDGRFRLHDLLHGFASELADRDAPAAVRRRLYDSYVKTAAVAARLGYPEEAGALADVPVSSEVIQFLGPDEAVMWLTREQTNLVAIALDAHEHHDHESAIWLSRILWRFLMNSCHHEDAIKVHSTAAESARVGGDHQAEAHALNNLASALHPLGRIGDAITCLERAAVVGRGTSGEWLAAGNLSGLYWFAGRLTDAVDSYERSLRLRSKIDHPHQHFVHPNLAGVVERLGRADELSAHTYRAIGLARQHDDLAAESYGQVVLAGVCRLKHHFDDALIHALKAHEVATCAGYRPADNSALNELARVYLALRRPGDALRCLNEALEQCDRTADRANDGYTLALLGETWTALGKLDLASQKLRRALTRSRDSHDRDLEVKVVIALGTWSSEQGLHSQAIAYYDQGAQVAEASGNRYEHGRALHVNGAARLHFGAAKAASALLDQAHALFAELSLPGVFAGGLTADPMPPGGCSCGLRPDEVIGHPH